MDEKGKELKQFGGTLEIQNILHTTILHKYISGSKEKHHNILEVEFPLQQYVQRHNTIEFS